MLKLLCHSYSKHVFDKWKHLIDSKYSDGVHTYVLACKFGQIGHVG